MKDLFLPVVLLGLAIFSISSCQTHHENYQQLTADPDYLHESMKRLSDVLVHDIFSPPQASRNYAYPSIAAYEVARHLDSSYHSFTGQLTDLKDIPQPQVGVEYCFPVAVQEAFLLTARKFVFSEDSINTQIAKMHNQWQEIGLPKEVYERSLAFGQQVADHIIKWADGDNYNESRSFSKYTVTSEEDSWKPTPPAYGEGIEPHWREIRPFVIDSAQQFRPELPTKFSTEQNSAFYKEIMEVYDAVNNADKEQTEIANFWDCNPYKLNVIGHVMHATKKITPGGHWIGIAKIAAQKSEANLVKSCHTYAMTSIALADAFISCWDEKYRSKLIRPETVINEYIDDEWVPILQTPPFPEYTSGHSVISTASAIVLSELYGDEFAFDDDTEVEYGLPIRSFSSFKEASAEAAISRLYGGIHYRPAIDNGVKQGARIGQHILSKLDTKS